MQIAKTTITIPPQTISKDNPEAELILRAGNGDDEAFEKLVDKYLVYIGNRADLANRRNRSLDPNEIVSRTLAKFNKLIENFDFEKGDVLGPVLARTINNIELDLLRSLSREKRGLHGYKETLKPSFLEKTDPVKEARDENLIAQLIKPLEKNERIVIVLTIEGYSPEEIGGAIDRSDSAVRQLKSRAIKKMSEALHRSRDSESVNVAA